MAAPAMTTYHCNETLIHEIAHALDHAIRIQDRKANREPGFKQARNQTYLSAMEAGLWAGRYESTVSHEYWAEMVVHWLRPDLFRTQFGLSDLSEYDSKAARLVEQYLGNPTLPDFVRPGSSPSGAGCWMTEAIPCRKFGSRCQLGDMRATVLCRFVILQMWWRNGPGWTANSGL